MLRFSPALIGEAQHHQSRRFSIKWKRKGSTELQENKPHLSGSKVS
ncbi:hypothetical protein C5167_028419 [Papaver somniferum]|nr:hypothetical protein C5167_028419 [Papaver somniferum]